MAETYESWMGWIPFESSYPYLTPQGLATMGDSGRAYGMYQFDYRYGLVPFMQSCVNYDSSYYSGFNTYIAYGAGSSSLVNNESLRQLFLRYGTERTQEFQYLQDTDAVNSYLFPILNMVQAYYGYDLRTKGAYVVGSAFSMSIRFGANPAYTFFAGGASLNATDLLNLAYSRAANQSYDGGRWQSGGNYSQYDAVFAQMNAGTEVYTVPYGGAPPTPTHVRKKSKIWMYLRRRY